MGVWGSCCEDKYYNGVAAQINSWNTGPVGIILGGLLGEDGNYIVSRVNKAWNTTVITDQKIWLIELNE